MKLKAGDVVLVKAEDVEDDSEFKIFGGADSLIADLHERGLVVHRKLTSTVDYVICSEKFLTDDITRGENKGELKNRAWLEKVRRVRRSARRQSHRADPLRAPPRPTHPRAAGEDGVRRKGDCRARAEEDAGVSATRAGGAPARTEATGGGDRECASRRGGGAARRGAVRGGAGRCGAARTERACLREVMGGLF